MFSLARTLEIFLFAFCNFAPYVFLTYWIFKKHFRFSKGITAVSCALIFLIQFATRYWSAMAGINTSVFMSIIRLTIFMIGFAILFDQRFGKILFIELIFANLGNFILIAAVCLERNLFPNINHTLYCWHTSVVMLLLHIIITLPWAFEVRRYFIPMLDNQCVKKEWNYYWLVPTVFYIIWQYQINGGTKTGLENIQNPHNVIFLFVINFGSLLIYYIMLKLDGELAKNLELEQRQHYHDLQQVEYRALQERIEETKRMRHDLRHHIHTVSFFLQEKEYGKLQEYVQTYQESIPNGESFRFCEHSIINTIVFYFASLAKEHNIDFQVQLSVPKDISVKEHDLSVLLGNLLENALHACREQKTGDRKIIMKGKFDHHSLVLTIDNTFENDLQKDENGNLLTTKTHGQGIGIKSAKKVVENYNGYFHTEKKNNLFCVSLMLNL